MARGKKIPKKTKEWNITSLLINLGYYKYNPTKMKEIVK